ncbi:MAG TPA: FAD-dependent oxidoreductase [Spirochaetia bacterium]|nr:FAD-dependent oxidoreductase [Spirochaetia bacterium]
MLIAILTLALFNRGDNGYPQGGSLQFSRDIERRYLELGGKLHYRSKVAQILVEGGRSVGVRLAAGGEVRADIAISAADGHATLFEMLGEAYLDSETIRCYSTLKPFRPLVYVCLGINRDLSAEPHIVTNVLDPPIEFAAERHELLGWFHYCYDPSSAPHGKSAVVSMVETSFEFWERAHRDSAVYAQEKHKVAGLVIDAMERRYPGIASQVEVIDFATPLTWVRYTGNWRGAYEGWLPTREALSVTMKKSFPGLKDFYLCGQWVEPGGGVPVSVISGRNVIKLICKADRRSFAPLREQ